MKKYQSKFKENLMENIDEFVNKEADISYTVKNSTLTFELHNYILKDKGVYYKFTKGMDRFDLPKNMIKSVDFEQTSKHIFYIDTKNGDYIEISI